MDYFPLFLRVRGEPVLLVGGGDVALRKLRLLLDAGGRATVVALRLCEDMHAMAREGAFEWHARRFEDEDLNGMRLVIAATDDAAVNRTVFEAAEARGILVNAVDQPDACRFITPSIVDRSPLMIAISTGGGVPVLARRVRTMIEAVVPHRYGALARLCAQFRDRFKLRWPDPDRRRDAWEAFLDGPQAEGVLAGHEDAARATLDALSSASPGPATRKGVVYVVGAGPGNPDLLTLRALRLMQRADVVLHDNLVPDTVMHLVRRDARRIYVGKQNNNHALPQQDINALMVRLAREGNAVLRLKGGDPFIFGRGGEEIETLRSEGIPFEVVPGVTSASGASCFAGIPLTHRHHAQSVAFVTGHRREDLHELEWTRGTGEHQTLVIYMGLHQAASIADQLIANGRSRDTPVAVVERATLPEQRVFIATLDTLGITLQQHAVKSPALLIVGSVVRLYRELHWSDDAALQVVKDPGITAAAG